LKRRGVFHVTGLYAVGAWAVVQLVDAISGPFPLPEEALRHIWLAALLGFPFAVTFGWRYDLTRHGIVHTNPRSTNGDTIPLVRSDYAIMVTLTVLLLGLLAVTTIRVVDVVQEARHDGDAATAPTSIAVLPFSTCGGAEYDDVLAMGIAGDVIRRLEHLDHARVIGPVSSFAFRESGFEPERIAEALGVEYVVPGLLCRQRRSLQLEIELVDAKGRTRGAVVLDQAERPDVRPLGLEAAAWIGGELELNLPLLPHEVCSRIGAHYATLAGREYLRRGNRVAAREAFTAALEDEPECGDALAGVVDVDVRELREGDPARQTKLELQASAAQQALANAPESDYTVTVLAAVLKLLGRHDEAARLLRPILVRHHNLAGLDAGFSSRPTIRPDHDWAELEYFRADQRPVAFLDIRPGQGAAGTDPVPAAGHVLLVEQILESDPLDVGLVSELAWAYHFQGDYVQALAVVERLHALPEFPPAAWRTQFHLALRNGRLDTAIGLALGMLASQGPGLGLDGVRRDLAEAGLALGSIGLHDEMNEWLAHVEEVIPAEARFAVGIRRLQTLGEYEGAAVIARRWLDHEGAGWWRDAAARLAIPRALLMAGDSDAVIRLLEPLYPARDDAPVPEDAVARILGLAYRAEGQDEAAGRIFTRLTADIPDEEARIFELGYEAPEAFESLAEDYLLAGRPYDAIGAYESAVDRHCRRRPPMHPGSLWRVVEGHPRMQVLNNVIEEDLARQARRARALLAGQDVDALLASAAQRWQP
jgi:TolB-like protein/tetratricopeptide (TPR) repeat protein